MPRLALKLLGGFDVRAGPDRALDIANKKTRALLAYLAMPAGKAHSREKLIGLLWGDRGDEQGRNSLRQAVAELGRAFAGAGLSPLLKERDTLSLDQGDVDADVSVFRHSSASGDPANLERALSLYEGELLDGFPATDPAFDEWLESERRSLHELAISVLERLMNLESGQRAIKLAKRLLEMSPLQEGAHRALMRLHAKAGNMGLALSQYEACRELLMREVGVAPSPETEALARELRGQSQSALTNEPAEPVLGDHPALVATRETSKPRIAVLPFKNLSGDREQQYFSDGLSEDIIIELSRFHFLQVIARASAFTFRGTDPGAMEIGRALDAQYILEGSVRRMNDRIRITVQLVEAATGNQLWAERYDRAMGDVFAVQDEVVSSVAAALADHVGVAVARQARRKQPENVTAYEWLLRGIELIRAFDHANNRLAQEMLAKAIALDPELAPAHAYLGLLDLREWWVRRSAGHLQSAMAHATNAVASDHNDATSHSILGQVLLEQRRFDDAAFHLQRGLSLNPNDPPKLVCMGALQTYRGFAADGVQWTERAIRLDPLFTQAYNSFYAMALFAAGRDGDCLAYFRRLAQPLAWDLMYAVAALVNLGRAEEARSSALKFAALSPHEPLLAFAAKEPYENSADLERLLAPLRALSTSSDD